MQTKLVMCIWFSYDKYVNKLAKLILCSCYSGEPVFDTPNKEKAHLPCKPLKKNLFQLYMYSPVQGLQSYK